MKLKTLRGPRTRIRSGVITADDIRRKFRLPANAKITVTVPGGADWSGMDIELGTDFEKIDVTVEETK